MTAGWQQPIGAWQPPSGTIALICDKNFPADDVLSLVEGVKSARPDATWIVRGTDKRAGKILFLSLGIAPLSAPLVAYWKVVRPPRPEAFEPDLGGDRIDLRARWRDLELITTCEWVLVARDRAAKSSLWWRDQAERHPNIKIAER